MIAVDTNVLVYAHRVDSTFHRSAAATVARLAESRTAWAIPWTCIHEFLAVTTHPRIFDPPTPIAAALDQVQAWLESPSLCLLHEANDHWGKLRGVLHASGVTAPGCTTHILRRSACPTASRNCGASIATTPAFQLCESRTRWLPCPGPTRGAKTDSAPRLVRSAEADRGGAGRPTSARGRRLR